MALLVENPGFSGRPRPGPNSSAPAAFPACLPRAWGSSSFNPQRRFTPYTPHTPPLLPYPVYPVYPRGEDIPRIPPCSGYTPYTLLFWIYPVYPVYPIYPIYPVYPACADLPRFTPISDPLAALSDIFSPNNCAKPIARGSSGPVAVAAQPHPANPQAASRRERGTSGDPPPPRERGHFLLFTRGNTRARTPR